MSSWFPFVLISTLVLVALQVLSTKRNVKSVCKYVHIKIKQLELTDAFLFICIFGIISLSVTMLNQHYPRIKVSKKIMRIADIKNEEKCGSMKIIHLQSSQKRSIYKKLFQKLISVELNSFLILSEYYFKIIKN